MRVTHFLSPIGTLEITETNGAISKVLFIEGEPSIFHSSEILDRCVQQLQEYFEGTRTVFDLILNPEGTEFQKAVWIELQSIPFGKTISYLQLAKRLGDPKVIRAAGTANGKNPIAIIIPCHRVIGSDGSLTGYAGGLKRKQWLLEHESSQGNLFS
ncbi:MAG: methylated-DNA--[protein]-cysteine S-methyltransferase [Flavobacteriales bacterium]|nr:methylated-DNA--[protein]-cysteine S-methyltransferase [Flavobacteriales bacterium]